MVASAIGSYLPPLGAGGNEGRQPSLTMSESVFEDPEQQFKRRLLKLGIGISVGQSMALVGSIVTPDGTSSLNHICIHRLICNIGFQVHT